MKLLIIDNYDSFTFNLVQLFSTFGIDVDVYRNDEISLGDIRFLLYDAICISPGPKTPAESGICPEVVKTFSGEVPILGVCLGMQVINEAFGGDTVLAPTPVHGKQVSISHDGKSIFYDLPSPFQVARYHSLICHIESGEIETIAKTEDNIPMALRHRSHDTFGVQFHPESFLSENGPLVINNFLEIVYGKPRP